MLMSPREVELLTRPPDRRLVLHREAHPTIVQNPIQALRRDLAVTQDALEQIENEYYWLKGYGTGWKASHYGLSDAEWDAIQAEHRSLRERALALHKRIGLLRKQAGRRTSAQAHRG